MRSVLSQEHVSDNNQFGSFTGTKMSVWSFWSYNGVSYRLHYMMGPINTMGELASRVRTNGTNLAGPA